MSFKVIHGDMRDVLDMRHDTEPRFDSVVCDPPYEIGFMGKDWDRSGVAFDPKTWVAVKRVMKPGAHLAAFGGTRAFQHPDDVQVFGFTSDERDRAERFCDNNPEVDARFPLIEQGLGHDDCEALLKAEGIALPFMYLIGYKNNNCIGCVKGGAGYWNKIRVDFPDHFARMSALEREMNVAILKKSIGGTRVRVFLDELESAPPLRQIQSTGVRWTVQALPWAGSPFLFRYLYLEAGA